MFEPGPNDTLSQNFIVLVDKMAEIFEKNEKNDEKTQFQNYPKKSHRIRKNEKFKNWASPCFKWAQIMPRVKI